jgi:hypothetical protein
MAGGSRAARTYRSGLDQYDVSNPAAPVLVPPSSRRRCTAFVECSALLFAAFAATHTRRTLPAIAARYFWNDASSTNTL